MCMYMCVCLSTRQCDGEEWYILVGEEREEAQKKAVYVIKYCVSCLFLCAACVCACWVRDGKGTRDGIGLGLRLRLALGQFAYVFPACVHQSLLCDMGTRQVTQVYSGSERPNEPSNDLFITNTQETKPPMELDVETRYLLQTSLRNIKTTCLTIARDWNETPKHPQTQFNHTHRSLS